MIHFPKRRPYQHVLLTPDLGGTRLPINNKNKQLFRVKGASKEENSADQMSPNNILPADDCVQMGNIYLTHQRKEIKTPAINDKDQRVWDVKC